MVAGSPNFQIAGSTQLYQTSTVYQNMDITKIGTQTREEAITRVLTAQIHSLSNNPSPVYLAALLVRRFW